MMWRHPTTCRRLLLLLLLAVVCLQKTSWGGWISTTSAAAAGRRRRRLCAASEQGELRTTPSEEERPFYPPRRQIDESLLGDLTGGRPGAIIETEEQLALKAAILEQMEERDYPDWLYRDYGETTEQDQAEYDNDDPGALDAATLGTWTIQDLKSKFDYEWDPLSDEPDPNIVELNQPGVRYVEETEKDEGGVEVGYDPAFGPSNPMDRRTILGNRESYMMDPATRDDSMLSPQFTTPDDPEIELNEDVVQFRQSLDILETYTDEFLPDDIVIPRHVAKWHGYPEQTHMPPSNFSNNRFTTTTSQPPTDFNAMTPFRARQRAVELARAQNAEWLPQGVSQTWHAQQRAPYERVETLVGTLRKGECNPEIVQLIEPTALAVFGSCVELLSIEEMMENDTTDLVFRFHYHGLMKNQHGMKAWMTTLLQEALLEHNYQVTGVVFETGFRRRDAAYDGGDPWYGPSN